MRGAVLVGLLVLAAADPKHAQVAAQQTAPSVNRFGCMYLTAACCFEENRSGLQSDPSEVVDTNFANSLFPHRSPEGNAVVGRRHYSRRLRLPLAA